MLYTKAGLGTQDIDSLFLIPTTSSGLSEILWKARFSIESNAVTSLLTTGSCFRRGEAAGERSVRIRWHGQLCIPVRLVRPPRTSPLTKFLLKIQRGLYSSAIAKLS